MLKEVLQEESPKKPKSLMMSFKVLQKNKKQKTIFAFAPLRPCEGPGQPKCPPTVAPISPERPPRWMTA